jgi:hypothetical protein
MFFLAAVFDSLFSLPRLKFSLTCKLSIKVVPEQSGKIEYERKRLEGLAKKFINFLAIPSSLSRVFDFSALLGTTKILWRQFFKLRKGDYS